VCRFVATQPGCTVPAAPIISRIVPLARALRSSAISCAMRNSGT
jgi:hypothetical protein